MWGKICFPLHLYALFFLSLGGIAVFVPAMTLYGSIVVGQKLLTSSKTEIAKAVIIYQTVLQSSFCPLHSGSCFYSCIFQSSLLSFRYRTASSYLYTLTERTDRSVLQIELNLVLVKQVIIISPILAHTYQHLLHARSYAKKFTYIIYRFHQPQ